MASTDVGAGLTALLHTPGSLLRSGMEALTRFAGTALPARANPRRRRRARTPSSIRARIQGR
ncbi:hypothetical protein KMT30_20095 [Streptomyces sp. IBSBF 2953]|nr:hypothetical protein [Streptomyces hayashii]